MTVRARVVGGRLVVDEPTTLPEGTEVELVVQSVPGPDADAAAEVLDVDVERHLHWLETGEGEPWPPRDSSV